MLEYIMNFPPSIATVILSMFPIVELRGAIPVGIEVYKLSPIYVFFLSVIGNMIPVIFLLLFFPKLHNWIINHKFFGKHAVKFLERAEKKFSGDFAKYGALGLVIFVGIPLPMTGAWTGSLAAFIFNIPFKKSFPLILAGVVLAGIAVTLLTLFAGNAVRAVFLS